jgi:hypothetical protein
MKRLLLIALIGLSLLPNSMYSQEKEIGKSRFGLTFPDIGAIWHISDTIAFMPGIHFKHSWSRLSETSKASGNSLGVNASLRFYLPEYKGVRGYLTPKYQFDWGDNDSTSGGIATTHNHKVIGAWGVQYAISQRISIYGDIGVGYERLSHSYNSPYALRTQPISNGIGTEGTWGLIFYLK